MKKLALVSAIALISAGANAQVAATGTISVSGFPMSIPCGSTGAGGADGMVVNTATGELSGTICLDPSGSGQPFVLLGVSMSGNGTAGAIQIATDWGTTGPSWGSYSVINVATAGGIGCTTGVTPKMTCTATLFGMPATMDVN